MIVVRVELHSAITKRVTELARMHICNTGDNVSFGASDYVGSTIRGRCATDLDKGNVTRRGRVDNHRRQALHVWHLVSKMLRAMNYGNDKNIRCVGCARCPQCPEPDPMPLSIGTDKAGAEWTCKCATPLDVNGKCAHNLGWQCKATLLDAEEEPPSGYYGETDR